MKKRHHFPTVIVAALGIAFEVFCLMTLPSCRHTSENALNPIDTTGNNGGQQSSDAGWRCSPDTVYFNYDVLPILVSSCAMSGCHDAVTRADGYQLTDYASVMRKGVRPGDARNSKIYDEIVDGSMPPPGSGITVSAAQLAMIAKWINQGAKNLNCNPNYGACDTANVSFAAVVMPIVQNKCQGCHNAANPGGGIKLTNYTEVKASVASGAFWGSIAWLTGYSKMPKGGQQLSSCELQKIDAWIKKGGLNN